jgi:hypothetical protein
MVYGLWFRVWKPVGKGRDGGRVLCAVEASEFQGICLRFALQARCQYSQVSFDMFVCLF